MHSLWIWLIQDGQENISRVSEVIRSGSGSVAIVYEMDYCCSERVRNKKKYLASVSYSIANPCIMRPNF